MLVHRRLLFLSIAKVPRPGLNAEASVLNVRPPLHHFPENTFLIIIMREKFWLFFKFAGYMSFCSLLFCVGFVFMIMFGGLLILMNITGEWWSFLPRGREIASVLVLCVLSLAITTLLDRMMNNKMERKTEDYKSS